MGEIGCGIALTESCIFPGRKVFEESPPRKLQVIEK
jgi:hypothetical protein